MGMGLGSATGWLWERAHRSRRRVQPDEPEAPGTLVDRAVPRSMEALRATPVAPTADAVTPGRGPATPARESERTAELNPLPKTLVIIFGPPAVGKMTVGDALERRTGLRLFHNHHTIDLALRFFEYGTPPFNRLVSEFRTRIFEEVASSPLPGMVFTYVWAFEDESDARY